MPFFCGSLFFDACFCIPATAGRRHPFFLGAFRAEKRRCTFFPAAPPSCRRPPRQPVHAWLCPGSFSFFLRPRVVPKKQCHFFGSPLFDNKKDSARNRQEKIYKKKEKETHETNARPPNAVA
nr:hypothetical protein [Pandoravirus massiliensis]